MQVWLAIALTGAALLFGPSVAWSVFIGAGVCILANLVFALWVFRSYRAQEPGALVLRFYGAEIVKIAVILALFVAVFALVEGLQVPALLGAYFIVQVVPALIASGSGAR